MSNLRRYKVKIRGREFVVRGLTKGERRKLETKKTKESRNRYILETCVEGDIDWDQIEESSPGLIVSLLLQIIKFSGMSEDSTAFSEALEWIETPEGRAEALAIATVNGLTLETLYNCDPHDYAKYLVMGKFFLEALYGIPANQFLGLTDSEEDTQSNMPPQPVVGPDGSVIFPGAPDIVPEGATRIPGADTYTSYVPPARVQDPNNPRRLIDIPGETRQIFSWRKKG